VKLLHLVGWFIWIEQTRNIPKCILCAMCATVGNWLILQCTASNDIQPVEVYSPTGLRVCTEIWERLWNVHYGLGEPTHWMQSIEATVKRKQTVSFRTRIGTDSGMMEFVGRWVLSASSKNNTDFFPGDHAGWLQFCEQFQLRISVWHSGHGRRPK